MLQNVVYCPTLYSRIAEIKAVGQLPAQTKDRILPLLLTRPWPNAKHIETTWEKIDEAIGGRRFGLDLDRSQHAAKSDKPSATAFQSLFNSKDGFLNYYSLLGDIPQAIPVLRTLGGSVVEIESQSKRIERLDRGAIIRIEFGYTENPFLLIDNTLKYIGDATFFIDTGWARDILNRELWASRIIEHISQERPEVEIVLSGSSFPDSFVNFGKRRSTSVNERTLYSILSRRHNAAALVYGDWGSTRPPAEPTPMKNIPRIDFPLRSEWISFRRDQTLKVEEDYSDIAQRVIDDPSWSNELNIWGTYAIGWTAKGEPGAIRGSASAAAARINIHLHRQAFFDGVDLIVDGDEPFTDD